jgi:5-methylcytosine-specific restriction protein A
MPYGFEPGRVYNRRADIHARFGGSQRGGIITTYQPDGSTPGPIFIVTGSSGASAGYHDRWREDGVFEYFGMGQRGDMTLSVGNKAIAESIGRGRSILLFEEVKDGLKFVDELLYEAHHEEQAPDADGKMRRAIVFELRPIAAIPLEYAPADPDPIDELRRRAYEAAGVRDPKPGKPRTIFERSRDVRAYVLARARGNCEGCSHPAPFLRPDGSPYLEPHHIRRISDRGPDHPALVIALCPNCHRRVHAGADGPEYNAELLGRMPAIEGKLPH